MDNTKPNILQIIAGGAQMTAHLLTGEVESILVRYISIREIGKLEGLENDEAALIEFICAKEKGWADLLHPASFEEVLETGKTLNFPIRERWLARQFAVLKNKLGQMERLAEAVPEALKGVYEAEIAKLKRQVSVTSAQHSLSEVSAPSTVLPTSPPVTPSSSGNT